MDPSEIERLSRVQKIRTLLDQILFESGYSVAENDLLDQDKDRDVRENLIELLFGRLFRIGEPPETMKLELTPEKSAALTKYAALARHTPGIPPPDS